MYVCVCMCFFFLTPYDVIWLIVNRMFNTKSMIIFDYSVLKREIIFIFPLRLYIPIEISIGIRLREIDGFTLFYY